VTLLQKRKKILVYIEAETEKAIDKAKQRKNSTQPEMGVGPYDLSVQ
jgi:hypothetical protein